MSSITYTYIYIYISSCVVGSYDYIVSVSALLIAINIVTVKWSARGQTFLSVLSIAVLLVVISIGFTFAISGKTILPLVMSFIAREQFQYIILIFILQGSTDGWSIGFEGSSLNIGDWCVAFFSASFAFSG